VLAHEGFGLFFRQEYPRVVLYLRKNGASEAEAEDAAQEAMIQTYKAWEKIQFPRAWVRKAAFTSYLRLVEKARKENAVPEPGEFMTGRAGSTDGKYEESQEEWRVIAIMRQLPSEQRKVAALFYDGLPPEEIAEVIGKSAATVRSLLRHARTRLKEVIQSDGVDSLGAIE
jgi:RNA polymerase sigma factor (sigma-70 family)